MTNPGSLTWETLETTVSHRCSAFDVLTEQVKLPNGTTTRFDYVREPDSAIVLGLTEEEEVVLLREYRHAVGRTTVGLPGGSIEPSDADLEATARRELAEEAGYRADSITLLLAGQPATGSLETTRHYFLAQGCHPAGTPDRDHDETMYVQEQPFEEVLAAVCAGDIRDERTVVPVLYYAQTEADYTR